MERTPGHALEDHLQYGLPSAGDLVPLHPEQKLSHPRSYLMIGSLEPFPLQGDRQYKIYSDITGMKEM
jgi:hypothetical protein